MVPVVQYMSEATDASKQAVSAGRGVAYIAGAKLYFMVAGFAIETLLPRLFGKALFGAYAFVAGAVSNLNNVFVTGTIQAVSRYTTVDPERADHVKAAGLRMHLVVGVPVVILYAALAPLWAHLAHDPGKTGLLALSAAIVAGYAFYSVLVGSANGTRAFHKQARLDITFATLRAGGILAAAYLGLGVYGAIGGWAAAVALVLVVAAVWVGLPRGAKADPIGPMARFFGRLAPYLILLNLILSVDQYLLKRLSTEWYQAHPGLVASVSKASDVQVAFYRAAQNLARLPYQLMLAVTFVIFPLISRSTFEADHDRTRAYIRTTLRYSLIFAAFMGTTLAANPGPMVDVLYAPEFAAAGGPAMAALALGSVAFIVFTIAGTVLNGAGHTRDATLVAGVTLALLTGALFVVVPRFAPGRDMLLACGVTTGSAMALGALLSGWFLVKRFGTFVPVLTVVRVGLAVAGVLALGRVIPARRPLQTLATAAAYGAVYLVILVVTGELGPKDLLAIRRRGT